MDKNSKISQILNGRTENSFFIDVEINKTETNLLIIKKLHHENLLKKFLDDYFKYRMKSNNFPKRQEYLKSLQNYASMLNGKSFYENYPEIDDDLSIEEFEKITEILISKIENSNNYE